MTAYYPRRVKTLKDLKKAYPDYETWDDDEEDRLEGIIVYVYSCSQVLIHLGRRDRLRVPNRRKAAGKGAPKKKKSPEGKLKP